MAAYICLDAGKGLLDGIEVGRVGGKKDQLATYVIISLRIDNARTGLTSLVFDQLTDIFSVVDATVVEYNNATGTRIWVCERELKRWMSRIEIEQEQTHNMFTQENQKPRCSYRSFNDVVCDNSIERQGRED